MKINVKSIIFQIFLYCVIFSAAVTVVVFLKGSKTKPQPEIILTSQSSQSDALPQTSTTARSSSETIEFTAEHTTAVATTVATTATTVTTAATTAVTSATQPQTEPPGPVFTHPELAESSQVLLVTVENESTSHAIIKFFEKSDGAWREVFTTQGRVGKNGIIPKERRMQDTDKTPAGIMKIIGAFGTNPDPGTAFDYISVTDNMYWDLNSTSPNYNRLVYSDPGGIREHLIVYGKRYGTYKYSLITDYNYQQAAGKGGAIFIHCNGKGGTAGCVSLPENHMKDLMAAADPAKHPMVVITLESELPEYMS